MIKFLEIIFKCFKYIFIPILIITYFFAFFANAYIQISYPFNLEILEGAVLNSSQRILSNQNLYLKPSIDFIPFNYPPLYFYLAALLIKIIGPGLIPLRFLSFIACLGSLIIIYLFVQKETKNKLVAALSCALFIASYRLSTAWFFLARIDSLFIFFALLGFYLVKIKKGVGSALLAGLVLGLSFLTKQTAILAFLPLTIYCFFTNRRRGIFFVATFLVVSLGSIIIMDYLSQGWFFYYVFELPTQHGSVYPLAKIFSSDILKIYPLLISILFFLIGLIIFVKKGDKKNFYFLSNNFFSYFVWYFFGYGP